MDINKFSDQLRKRMEEGIQLIQHDEQDELKATARIKNIIFDILIELKKFIHEYDFLNQQEEICFFKEIKPYFLSSYLYNDQLFMIQLNDSYDDMEDRRNCYLKQLKKLKGFQIKNIDFYLYWLNGSNHLDKKYFTRQANSSCDLNLDNRFSTGYDIVLSRLMVNDKLKEYLQTALRKGDQKHGQQSCLKWTGSKSALVELIYALQTVGVFNNGVADVKQVAIPFEELFDVELGNYYDTFQQIRIRKVNQTKFLDQLKEKLLIRIESINHLT